MIMQLLTLEFLQKMGLRVIWIFLFIFATG